MSLENVIQNNCLSEKELQECCIQGEEPTLECAPNPEELDLSTDKEMDTSPYYHREIF